MMDMNLGSMMNTGSMASAFMNNFRTGNVILDYILNLAILGGFGFLTTTLAPKIQAQGLKDIFTCGKTPPARPQLKFIAKKTNDNWSLGITASAEYRAWLGKIRDVITDSSKNGPVGGEKLLNGGRAKTLLQLQEFTAARSIYSKVDEAKTEWQPDQSDAFQISDTIWCQFETKNVEDRGSDMLKIVETYILTVFSKKNIELSTLVTAHTRAPLTTSEVSPANSALQTAYHNELMEAYHNDARLTLSAKPHIFELQSVNQESGKVFWSKHEFSATRKMEHVWFKQKDVFMQAYNNFKTNEAEYERRGDPYTFNCLLYGTPGCGKSSLIKALVNDSVQRGKITHVFVVSFSNIKNGDDLSRVMFNATVDGHYIPYDQRLVVFEDFDVDGGANIFKKRDNVGAKSGEPPPLVTKKTAEGGLAQTSDSTRDEEDKAKASTSAVSATPNAKNDMLTLSAILNVLDGINERTGQMCFWTTNASPPEDHFDAAFLRPGRMDMKIDFTKCTAEGVAYLLRMYFGDAAKLDQEKLELLEDDKWYAPTSHLTPTNTLTYAPGPPPR